MIRLGSCPRLRPWNAMLWVDPLGVIEGVQRIPGGGFVGLDDATVLDRAADQARWGGADSRPCSSCSAFERSDPANQAS